MDKIKWNMEKDQAFLKDAKSLIICNYCGWLIKDPEKTENTCTYCGKTYRETNSQIQNNK